MTAAAANWVWTNSRATNGSLLVLLAVADELDAKGNCVMSLAELAAKSRLSKSAVAVALGDLTRHGEVSVTPRAGGHGRNGYAVCCPDSGHLDSRGVRNQDTEVSGIKTPSESRCPESALGQTGQPAGQPPSSPESGQQAISDERSTTTGRSGGRSKPSPAKPPKQEDRPDVGRLCEHLASRIEANTGRRPNITQKWQDAARLLLDADGRTEEQVLAAINWCQDDEFWRSNILSMPKLREKYDQLRLRAKYERDRKTWPAQNGHQPTHEEFDALRENWARPLDEQEAGIDPRGNGRPDRVYSRVLPAAENRQGHSGGLV